MICPVCNNETLGHETVCQSCGAKVDSKTGIAPASGAPVEAIPKPRDDLADTIIERCDEPTPIASHKPIYPTVGDRYEIIEELGRGGFAEVFRGRDKNLNREVAIKRLLIQKLDEVTADEVLQRFRIEAHSIAKLKHKNIVSVYDYDRDDKGYYIVMEYIDGGSLNDLLKKRKKLPPPEAINLAKGIAQGLYYAHRNKLIHRDIKPDNVMIINEDGGQVPKIVDFGLARAGKESDISVTGFAMGTPGYMAPEQRADAKNVDHRADIYSLGKVLYKMLTGEKPADVIPKLIPPPPDLADIIFKCINPRPQDRYFSIDALIKDLDSITFKHIKQRDTMQLILENICPTCDAPNSLTDKFCSNCGAGLAMNCPECEKENSIHRAFCTGCGTDMPLFNRVRDVFKTMRGFYEEHNWSRIIQEHDHLPENIQLPQPKGLDLLHELHGLRDKAQEMIESRKDIREQLDNAIENSEYKQALAMLDDYREIDPDDTSLTHLPELLTFKLFESEFINDLESLRGALETKKLRQAGSLVAALEVRRTDFDCDHREWDKEWIDRFEDFEQMQRDAEERIERLEELEQQAARAFETQRYEQCVTCCTEIGDLCVDSHKRERLHDKSLELINEISTRTRNAERLAANSKWRDVLVACDGVLALQRTHVLAGTLRRKAAARIRRQRMLRKVVSALAAGLIVFAFGAAAWQFNKKSKEKERRAAHMLEQIIGEAESYLEQSRAATAIDSAEALNLLTLARQRLLALGDEAFVPFVDATAKSRIHSIESALQMQRDSIRNASRLYEGKMKGVAASLVQITTIADGEPATFYDVYLSVANELSPVMTAQIYDYLDADKREKIEQLNQQIEQGLRDEVIGFATTIRTTAKTEEGERTSPFLKAEELMNKVREASIRGSYFEAGELAIQAVAFYRRSIETVEYGAALEHARTALEERLGNLDPAVIASHAPEKWAAYQAAADKAVSEQRDYRFQEALDSIRDAAQSLAGAIDAATARLVNEGIRNPLQIQIFNQARETFMGEFDVLDKTTLDTYAPAPLRQVEGVIALAATLFEQGRYVEATDAYGSLMPKLGELRSVSAAVEEQLREFRNGLIDARQLLIESDDLIEADRRRVQYEKIMTVLNRIMTAEIEKLLDFETINEYQAILSKTKKNLENPAYVYESDLIDARRYIDEARLDIIKQKSPKENCLVALNFISKAVARGLPAAHATGLRKEALGIQLTYLDKVPGSRTALSPTVYRGWLYHAVDLLGLTTAELAAEYGLEYVADGILPPSLKPLPSSDSRQIRDDDKVWFRMYPDTVENPMQTRFCLIPSGQFVMGNNTSEFDTEKPEHTVSVDYPYYMAMFECLVGDYREFASDVLSVTLFNDNDVPVSGIHFRDAARYCNWLNERFGLTPSYACATPDEAEAGDEDWSFIPESVGYRIATEAEWEHACKYGEPGAESSEIMGTPWYSENSGGAVLSANPMLLERHGIQPNTLGLYLMRGNLAELVSGWFEFYKAEPRVNPTGPLTAPAQARNIARGGDLRSSRAEVSPTYRKRVHPDVEARELLGFRLVMPLHFDQVFR